VSSKSRKRKAADRRYRAWLKAVTSRPYLYIPDNTYVAPELLEIIRRHFEPPAPKLVPPPFFHD
jgi:predicted protein tyrosine phosphatase